MKTRILIVGTSLLVAVFGVAAYRFAVDDASESKSVAARGTAGDQTTRPQPNRIAVTRTPVPVRRKSAPAPSFSGVSAEREQNQRVQQEEVVAPLAARYAEFLTAASLSNSQRTALRDLVAEYKEETNEAPTIADYAAEFPEGITPEQYAARKMADQEKLTESFREELKRVLTEEQYREFEARFSGDLFGRLALGVFDQT